MEGDSICKRKNPNLRENASLLSLIGFAYAFPIFLYGYRKQITEDDIYETLSVHKSSILGEKSITLWQEEVKDSSKKNTQPSLWKVFVKLLLRDYLLLCVSVIICELFLRPMQTFLLGKLIMCYSKDEATADPHWYALGMIICTAVQPVVAYPIILECYHLALKVRVICCSLVYNKALKLSRSALAQTTPGQIINLISNDVSVFDRIMYASLYLWAGPAQAAIFLYMIYNEVGVSSVFGVAFLTCFIPLYYALGKATAKIRRKTFTKTDTRLRLMNEIVQGIYVIKMYAWEIPFSHIVASVRKRELNFVKLGLYIKSVYLSHSAVNTVGLSIGIISAVLINQTLNAKSVFIMSLMFYYIGLGLNFALPQGMIFLHELFVTLNRIKMFLLSDETEMPEICDKPHCAIAIENCSAKWDKSSKSSIFSNLSLDFESNSLTAIIGAVGSGKSGLINVILGEMTVTSGRVGINGRISYSSQEPWIFSSSIRQNILFGSKMDEHRYNAVIQCCGLAPDFKLLPYGDSTTIGEKGMSLSGGQKARLSLARAIYRQADIYLLDEPLAAVDVHVGKQIFEQCIKQFLSGKTVILVTNQLQYLARVNYIVVLDNGAITAQGRKTDLEQSGFDFAKYLQNFSTEPEKSIADNKYLAPTQTLQLEKRKETVGKSSRLVYISLDTYKEYFLASKNYFCLGVTICLFILVQLSLTSSYYYLSHWVNVKETRNATNYGERHNLHIYTYSGITIMTIILTILRSFALVNLAKDSSTVLHDQLFKNVVHAKMKFFNSNSSGVILNRFAKDMAITDDLLPNAITVAFRIILSILGIFAVISAVNPWFLIPAITVLIIMHYLRRFYLATHLNVMRIEGKVRGPLYGYMNSSLQGLTTIRAFGKEKLLQTEFNYYQDTHSSAYFTSILTSVAFSCWIDLIIVLYLIVLTIYYTFNADSYGSDVGLVISQTLQLIGQIAFGVKYVADVESFMVSVERILEYNSIDKERKIKSSTLNLPSSWPQHGEIHFKNVCLRYSPDSPYVLKNINLKINPLEKIGIVGRTGAGKSSIISALFQLAKIEGIITIDDIDIHTIDLNSLRTKITIIPQDPVLFSGSIRYNLDPFEKFHDDELWKALEEVQLKNVINNLKSEVNIDGSNFSVGQRQLICLARAIVQNNKILILDEATANVDIETDVIIQKIIRNKFMHCTVLTVAHRLSTVIDSDRILVMDEGVGVEFDHPHVLLQNENGIFYSMVHRSEKAETESLVQEAREHYRTKEGLK